MQIALPLDWQTGAEDGFVVTPANAEAVHLLDNCRSWPVRTAILVGPPRSGRSLLARLWADKSGGAVVDDADHASETALFTAWNDAEAIGRPQLFVAAALPPAWAIVLPDLASRLAASPRAVIGAPDDALIRALLEHGFARRQLVAPPALIDWLAARLNRDHAEVEGVVRRLDQAVTERQRRLSIPLARDTLAFAPETP